MKKSSKPTKKVKSVSKKYRHLVKPAIIVSLVALVVSVFAYNAFVVTPDINRITEGGGAGGPSSNLDLGYCSAKEKKNGCKVEVRTMGRRKIRDCFCPTPRPDYKVYKSCCTVIKNSKSCPVIATLTENAKLHSSYYKFDGYVLKSHQCSNIQCPDEIVGETLRTRGQCFFNMQDLDQYRPIQSIP